MKVLNKKRSLNKNIVEFILYKTIFNQGKGKVYYNLIY